MTTRINKLYRRLTAKQVGLGFDPPEVRKPVTAVQQVREEVTA
jgi:hypothetical protein